MSVQTFNNPVLYVIVGVVIGVIVLMCLSFLQQSWNAGLQIGMDKAVMKKAIFSNATFSILPGVSILLGVVALSGTLGVPLPWLRLSVIGNLQYEVNVAQIAATGIGLSVLVLSEMTAEAFVTICLVMTCGILGGALLCIFSLKLYTNKLKSKPKEEAGTIAQATPNKKQKSFGDWAMIAMFVGMCATYVGSYIGQAAQSSYLPLLTALAAAAFMALCEWLERKDGFGWLENFDLAASMLFAMAFAVCINPML